MRDFHQSESCPPPILTRGSIAAKKAAVISVKITKIYSTLIWQYSTANIIAKQIRSFGTFIAFGTFILHSRVKQKSVDIPMPCHATFFIVLCFIAMIHSGVYGRICLEYEFLPLLKKLLLYVIIFHSK